MNLYSRIFNVNKNKDRYYDSIQHMILKQKMKSRFYLKNKKFILYIYSQSKLAKMLLVSVENYCSKEKNSYK